MNHKLLIPALAATLALGACSDSPTEAPVGQADDYALQMFGEPGTALEGTFGDQPGDRPFDGRTGRPVLPDSLALTDEQRDSIATLRATFRAEHAAQIDALQAIFEEAREARQAGASREEVREILLEGRLIAIDLRFDVIALHEAIWDVFTEAQQRWIAAHKPRRFPRPIGRP